MPRTKRAPKTTEPTPPEPPKCARCGRELDWRDRFYAGAATATCKRCHRRDQRRPQRGFVAFHPAPVVNRSARRVAGRFAEDCIAAYGARIAREQQAKRTLAVRRTARSRAAA